MDETVSNTKPDVKAEDISSAFSRNAAEKDGDGNENNAAAEVNAASVKKNNAERSQKSAVSKNKSYIKVPQQDNIKGKADTPLANGGEKAETQGLKNNPKKGDRKNKNGKSHWALKSIVITFFLSAFFSFISELTASTGSIVVTVLLLTFLILGSILADGVGVAVAACELAPLLAMASKKVPGSKMAIKLVKNAEVVANICNDIIGDIFSILSGACITIVAGKIIMSAENVSDKLITILVSSVVAAVIVGGKAMLKNVAINRSKEFVMLTARVLSVFIREKKPK